MCILKHSSPIIYLLIEFTKNSIIIDKSSFQILLIILLIYLINNFVLTFIFNIKIYKVITYKEIKLLLFVFSKYFEYYWMVFILFSPKYFLYFIAVILEIPFSDSFKKSLS